MNKITFTCQSKKTEFNTVLFLNNFKNELSSGTSRICAYTLSDFVRDCEFDNKKFFAYLEEHNQHQALLETMFRKNDYEFEKLQYVLRMNKSAINKMLAQNAHAPNDELTRFLVEALPHFHTFATKECMERAPKKALLDVETVLRMVVYHPCAGKHLAHDEAFLKRAVAVNVKVLGYIPAKVRGRKGLMRELCAVNPESAAFACSPIPKEAGAEELQGIKRERSIYQWLVATGEHKALNNASGGGLRRVKTAATPKPKFKI